jgi:hypothetical protein
MTTGEYALGFRTTYASTQTELSNTILAAGKKWSLRMHPPRKYDGRMVSSLDQSSHTEPD